LIKFISTGTAIQENFFSITQCFSFRQNLTKRANVRHHIKIGQSKVVVYFKSASYEY